MNNFRLIKLAYLFSFLVFPALIIRKTKQIFSRKAADKIFTRQRLERWGFDSEVLFIAKKMKLKVKEVPVVWSNNPKSKVKYPQDILYPLLDLIKIRYYSF